MTSNAVTFPYILVPGPPPLLRPLLPIVLARGATRRTEHGLVDSGADVSILPFNLGNQLGLVWNAQPLLPDLGGILTGVPARGAVLDATVNPFPAVQLAFAWVQKDDIPLILGQANCFMEFDVGFYRDHGVFRVEPHTP